MWLACENIRFSSLFAAGDVSRRRNGCFRRLKCARPLPSSKNPHFQNEARCTTFLVKMSFISISKAEHLPSFWNRGPKEAFGIMHYASVNSSCMQPPSPRAIAGYLPALSVPGMGHLKNFFASRGPGICQPLGQPRAFDTHAARGFLSEYNYKEDFTGKTSRLAHLSRTGKIEEVCKGMFSVLCLHFLIAYQARITRRMGSAPCWNLHLPLPNRYLP